EHQTVEVATLIVVDLAPLECLQIEADRSNRRLQLVSHGVEKTILLLISADFADQEDRVQHQSGDDKREEDDPKHQWSYAAPVDHDPADVQKNCQANQAAAQGDEKRGRFGPAGDAHGLPGKIVIDESFSGERTVLPGENRRDRA